MATITVGQVEALFRLRDEMSATLKNIQGETKKTGDAFSGLAGASFVFNQIRDAAGTVFGLLRSAVGSVVGTIGDLVGGLIESGGALSDMSSKTGTSVEFLQQFEHALNLSGSSIEAGTKAIGIMQKALVAGDADFARLGLRVSELKAMRPEDAFMATANAIAEIKNPTEQAAVAMGIFGKSGAELLPAMKNDLAGVMQQAQDLGFVMSSQTAAAADQLGDSIDTLSATWEGLKNNVASVIVENASLHAFIEKGIEILGRWSKAINQNKGDLGDLVSDGVIMFANALVTLLEVGIKVNDWLTAMGELWRGTAVAGLKVAEAFIKGAIAIRSVTVGEDEIMQGYDRDLAAVQKAIEGYGKASQDAVDTNTKWANNLIAMQSGLKEMAAAAEGAKGKTLELNTSVRDTGRELAEAGLSAEKRFELVQKVLDQEKQKWAETQKEEVAFALEKIKKIADAEEAAAEARANHAALVREALLDMQEQEIEAAQEATQKIIDAWDDFGAFAADLFDVFSAMGLDSFAAVASAGVETAQMLAQAAEQGFISWGQLANQIAGIVKNASVAGGALSGAMTGFAVGGPIGAGIGALAGGLLGLFGKAKQAREEMKKLSDQFIQSQGGMAALQAKAREAGISLEAMFKAKSAQQLKAAIDQIKGSLDLFAEAHEKTRAAAEEYGFTVEEMGEKWARQELDNKAATLIEKYKLLTAAGFDHNAILARMGPDFNEYVNEAIRAGVALPESMRKIVDELIAQGLLLDENGEAYKSAEEAGITYTQTMTEQFAGLMDMIERLVEALSRGFNVPVNVQYTTSTSGDPEHPGHGPSQQLAGGGLLQGPAGGYVPNAVFHGNEYVVPETGDYIERIGDRVAARLGGSNAGGRPMAGGRDEVIVVQSHTHIQGREVAVSQSSAKRRREGARPGM